MANLYDRYFGGHLNLLEEDIEATAEFSTAVMMDKIHDLKTQVSVAAFKLVQHMHRLISKESLEAVFGLELRLDPKTEE